MFDPCKDMRSLKAEVIEEGISDTRKVGIVEHLSPFLEGLLSTRKLRIKRLSRSYVSLGRERLEK